MFIEVVSKCYMYSIVFLGMAGYPVAVIVKQTPLKHLNNIYVLIAVTIHSKYPAVLSLNSGTHYRQWWYKSCFPVLINWMCCWQKIAYNMMQTSY